MALSWPVCRDLCSFQFLVGVLIAWTHQSYWCLCSHRVAGNLFLKPVILFYKKEIPKYETFLRKEFGVVVP